jgi:hypothetical protein
MSELSTFERAVQPRNADAVSHTPGPWTVERDGCGQLAPFHGVTGEHLLNDGNPAPLEEREANGRLIAAAPDMLALLKRVLACPMAASWLEADGGTYSAAKALVERVEAGK